MSNTRKKESVSQLLFKTPSNHERLAHITSGGIAVGWKEKKGIRNPTRFMQQFSIPILSDGQFSIFAQNICLAVT
jgi:hypothetical protein